MDEYISREAAIDKMRSLKSSFRAKNDWDSGYDTAIAEAFEHIKRVPAADVQPVKHGHWIEEVREIGETFRLYQTYIHCSECGKEHYSGTLPKPNFCDECGADMRGAENE